jgi:hypothetical protein
LRATICNYSQLLATGGHGCRNIRHDIVARIGLFSSRIVVPVRGGDDDRLRQAPARRVRVRQELRRGKPRRRKSTIDWRANSTPCRSRTSRRRASRLLVSELGLLRYWPKGGIYLQLSVSIYCRKSPPPGKIQALDNLKRTLGKGFMLSCWSVGYKTRVEYVDDGAAAGWRVNAEGSKTAMNLPSMKPSSNQQGGASGRQPSSSDANRASAAGASHRSP